MRKIKILIPFLTLFLCFGIQNIVAQEISKEVLSKIKEKEQEIRTSEEILISGVEGLERTKSRLNKLRNNKKTSAEEIEKKERILSKVEQRLTNLEVDIEKQKESLRAYKQTNQLPVKEGKKTASSIKETKKVVPKKTATKKVVVENNLEARKERLKNAQLKLEKERLAREETLKKNQLKLEKERLAIENAHQQEQAKLAALDNEIKAEEEKIKNAEEIAKNKALAEAEAAKKMIEAEAAAKLAAKQKIINGYEDDISVDEEILISGKEGLVRSKERLEIAKADSASTPEDIARKESIVKRVEERLAKLEAGIEEKKMKIKSLK